MILWRISNYVSLDGEGGMYASGRWHRAERRIVYTSDQPASALIEMVVHLGPVAKPKFCQLLKIEVPTILLIGNPPPLPSGWQNNSELTQAIGNRWLDGGTSAILAVPSAIVPEAFNYLVNPTHLESKQLKILAVQSVPLDTRLK